MKRICVMGAAAAGLFTAGLTGLAAATPALARATTRTKVITKTVTLSTTCTLGLVDQIPVDGTTVTQGGTSGIQYGTSDCTKGGLTGVARDRFSVDSSGTLTAELRQYFNTGTLLGTVSLTPSQPSGPPTTTSFTSESYSGTVTITGGRGTALGVHGTGTMSCTTADSAHYSCSEHVRLRQTVKVVVKR